MFATPSAPTPRSTFSDPAINAINALSPGPGGTLIATDGSSRPALAAMGARSDGARPQRPGAVARHRRRGSVRDPRRRTALCVRRLRRGRALSWSAKAGGTASSPSPRTDASARVARQSAGLSFAAFAGGVGRLLADGVHRAHPARRVRAARNRLSAPHDERNRSGILDRAATEIRPVVPREPMQGAHIKTMGVVKPWAPPRSYGLVIRLNARRAAASTRCTAASTASTMASWRRSRWTARSTSLAKGPGRLLRMPLAGSSRRLRA